ncbi:MAG: DNA recombination protein RmuC [Lewinellaceae bacterium]|nr:DNA recombination protein RmuC [Saprospiraceae bacterium]MCB9340306.1 DNA recombination protein RmuC [Lewinellaceae bacterium]
MSAIAVSFLFLVLGLLLGTLVAWMVAKLKFSAQGISHTQLQIGYVAKEIHESLQNQADMLREDMKEKEESIIVLEKALAGRERDLLYLEEKLVHWQRDIETLQGRAHLEFENIANRILEEKSKKFTDQNEKQLNDLLHPLREKIKDFGQDIDRRFTDEAKDKVSLKKEIESLRELNMQLSTDAQHLASALKGDSKVQGDWGELQLELLLEKSGLQKGIHFTVQPTYKDENGQHKRPDFVIHLPEGKHLVVDSKVSLKAYELFFNAESEELRAGHLKSHLDSLRNHIRELGSKNYQLLYQINSPDYLLLFVPIEPAFSLALQHDSKLFLEALEKNIVLVTTTTLMATMRTVSFIWRQERQKKNVLEIARQSGLLYDKFVSFVDDLQEIGLRLNQARNAWDGAMNKMSDSKRFGDTLIGRAQKIKELGAKTSKRLPADLLDFPERDDRTELERNQEEESIEIEKLGMEHI